MNQLEEKINEDIKLKLKEHRYIHSIGVMEMAEEMAKHYGLDIKKIRLTGLAHDIAKEMTWEEIYEYCDKYNIELNELERNNKELIHSKLGAEICKREYGFDEQMVNAILYHTTGNPEMDLFAKVIFVADKIEKNRNYEGIEERRKLAFTDIDMAIIEIINYTITDCIKRFQEIHPDSIKIRNKILLDKRNKINV